MISQKILIWWNILPYLSFYQWQHVKKFSTIMAKSRTLIFWTLIGVIWWGMSDTIIKAAIYLGERELGETYETKF